MEEEEGGVVGVMVGGGHFLLGALVGGFFLFFFSFVLLRVFGRLRFTVDVGALVTLVAVRYFLVYDV